MKKTILIFVLALGATLSYSQTNNAVGGAGVCVVDQDPDNITDMQTQDTRYECMFAFDKATQTFYVYDSTETLGSRWVTYQSTLPSVTNTNERLDNPRVSGSNLVFDIIDKTNGDNIVGTETVAINTIAPIQSVSDGTTIDFTVTANDVTAEVIDGSITPAKLDRTYLETEVDGSTTNEVNTSFTWTDGTNTLSITDPNSSLSAIITGFQETLTGNETVFDGWDKNAADDFDGVWSSLTGVPAGFADGIDNVDDADADATNELQTISMTDDVITLSDSGGSVTTDKALGVYKNHADAGTGGVSVGQYYYASTDNTMGIVPGTKVRRMF